MQLREVGKLAVHLRKMQWLQKPSCRAPVEVLWRSRENNAAPSRVRVVPLSPRFSRQRGRRTDAAAQRAPFSPTTTTPFPPPSSLSPLPLPPHAAPPPPPPRAALPPTPSGCVRGVCGGVCGGRAGKRVGVGVGVGGGEGRGGEGRGDRGGCRCGVWRGAASTPAATQVAHLELSPCRGI